MQVLWLLWLLRGVLWLLWGEHRAVLVRVWRVDLVGVVVVREKVGGVLDRMLLGGGGRWVPDILVLHLVWVCLLPDQRRVERV